MSKTENKAEKISAVETESEVNVAISDRAEAPVKKRNKKAAVVFMIVVLAIGIISGLILFIMELLGGEEEVEKGPTNMYSDELHSYIFYEPDYDLDVTTVPEYMDLDRMLWYGNGVEQIGITDDAEDFGEAVVFFEEYFRRVINGEWETYNDMFTDHYFETNKPKNQFAPQMIYDMHVTELWEKNEAGGMRYAFDVSYRIYKNNGTFRNDIDSGAAKVLYFELVSVNGTVKIDRITYYV